MLNLLACLGLGNRYCLLLQVRQPGTRCQTISAIRRLAKTLLGDCWRHSCLRCIRACSALEALRNALYKCSTYLLTYFNIVHLIFLFNFISVVILLRLVAVRQRELKSWLTDRYFHSRREDLNLWWFTCVCLWIIK